MARRQGQGYGAGVRAVVFQDGLLQVDDVPEPAPGPGQVLVRTLACGICGSDLHTVSHVDALAELRRFAGGPPLDRHRPLVMGHEYCAEVLAHGPDTDHRVRPGTRVCAFPVILGADGLHSVGYSHDHPGGYGEYMLLQEQFLLPVPAGLPSEMAALTEPMAVGEHAVEKAHLDGSEVVLVVGCGPVGLAVIAALKRRGHGPVVAADFSPVRRQLAERGGADHVVDPAAGSPYTQWEDLAWPDGVDRRDPVVRLTGPFPAPGVVFECVGVPGMLHDVMLHSMRETKVVVVGVCMESDTIQPLLGIGKQLELRFVLGYTADEFAATLQHIADGAIEVEHLVTGTTGFDGVPAAFEELATPNTHAKIVVVPE